MRAMVCAEFGQPDTMTLTTLPDPPLPDTGVRIRVAAAGVNFADGLFIAGRYQVKPTPPFTPGFEVAGTVLEAGSAVMGLAPGTPVMAMVSGGGYADQVVADLVDVYALPEGMDLTLAASFPIAYGTAHFGLWDRARLQAGESVLIHGAGSGVGLTAVEVAKAMGATVIATARGREKLETARTYGADHVLDSEAEDLRDQVKVLTGGKGVNVVYDPVGGPLFDTSLRCVAPDGRLLCVGFASGIVPQPPANILLVKNLSVIGYWYSAYRTIAPDRMRASMETLLAWWQEGRLKPLVSRSFPLGDAAQAIAALRDRSVTGKAVVLP